LEEDPAILARRAAEGDAAAVEQLLVRYLPSLRAFVRAHMAPSLRARESSSDLVQSVCREVLAHLDRFQHPGEGAFKHWLFTTAQRKIANRARDLGRLKRDARREVPLGPESGDGALGQVYARISSPSRAAARREDLERFEAALDQLQGEQREVLLLAHLVGLSRAEIGARLGKTEVAVRGLLHRATARLSMLLGAGEA
jgi:RNA polymerase sigma-70 factor (ECF subfamily)